MFQLKVVLFIIILYLSLYSLLPSYNKKTRAMENDFKWNDSQIKTVYYQGIWSSQIQAAKYTGKRGFNSTTGEHVICPDAIDVIKDVFIGEELDEIKLYDKNEWVTPVQKMEQILFGAEMKRVGYLITGTKEKSVSAHSIDIGKISIAQEHDIEQHKKKCDMLKDEKEIILYGVSRGAATTFNAISKNQYSNVKLVILEGCFYSAEEVFHKRYGDTFGKAFYNAALWTFPFHKQDGISPSKSVPYFPSGIPVAFITSKKDKSVHAESTIKLASELKRVGGNPVYLLVLENSSHPNYMFDDKNDRETYTYFIHALYEKYNLPFIEEYANLGKEILKESELKK